MYTYIRRDKYTYKQKHLIKKPPFVPQIHKLDPKIRDPK